MILGAPSLERVKSDIEPWVAPLLAGVSTLTVILTVYHPDVAVISFFVLLAITAFLHFDFFVYCTIFLLPFYPVLDFGLPLHDIFLLLRLVLFVGVWIRLRKRGKSIRQWIVGSKWKRTVLIFAGICCISVVLSGMPATLDGSRALARLLSYVAVFLGIDGWLENRGQILQVLRLLFWSTIVVALFGFIQAAEGAYTELYFSLYPLQREALASEPWSGRITSLLFHFNSLAGYLNLVIPIALASAAFAENRTLKIAALICTPLSVIALVLTQSRGGLLGLIGILALAVWFLTARLITKLKVLGAGLLGCLLLLPPLLSHFERFQGVDESTQLTRLTIWQAAAEMFVEHPAFGVGYGHYRLLYASYFHTDNPDIVDAHSLYLQLLAETGLAGALSFAVVLWLFLASSIKSLRQRDPVSRIVAFGVLGAIASTLFHGTVDFLFIVSPQFGTLFWMTLGLGSRVLCEAPARPIQHAPAA